MKKQDVYLNIYPRVDLAVSCNPIDYRKVKCRSIHKSEEFQIGGKSPIAQEYGIGQLVCTRVIESVLTHLETQESRSTFICDHGKHRSKLCGGVSGNAVLGLGII